jgi:hypothetical protein
MPLRPRHRACRMRQVLQTAFACRTEKAAKQSSNDLAAFFQLNLMARHSPLCVMANLFSLSATGPASPSAISSGEET